MLILTITISISLMAFLSGQNFQMKEISKFGSCLRRINNYDVFAVQERWTCLFLWTNQTETIYISDSDNKVLYIVVLINDVFGILYSYTYMYIF